MQHVPSDVSDGLRRLNRGDLIFVAKDNKAGATGAGNQLFYPGQTIDFTSSQIAPIDDVNSSLETQHNQYYVDPGDIDLEQSEYSDVVINALSTQKQVLLELEALQKSKDDLRVEIVNQQRILNESNLVISGLDVIISNDPDNDEMKDIRAQLQATADAAQTTIDEFVAELDTIPAAIRSKHSELRALAVLID
jgi:chromosome segregation ATPase